MGRAGLSAQNSLGQATLRATGNRLGPENGCLSVVSGRRQGRHVGGPAEVVPDLDKRLGLGITPGQAGFFKIVGTPAPLLSPLDRPVRDHASISQRVEDRSRWPR